MNEAKLSYEGVWIFAEQNQNALEEIGKQLLGKGRELADSLGEELAAVLVGHRVRDLCDELLAYGADKVYLAEHPELEFYRPLPYTRVVANLVRRYKPQIFLLGATTTSNDLASRVAARVKAGLASVCTDYVIGDTVYLRKEYKRLLFQIRPDFNGIYESTIITPEHMPQMATTRPGVFEPLKRDDSRNGTIVEAEPDIHEEDLGLRVKKVVTSELGFDLEKAEIIVSAGLGVSKDPEKGFALAGALAEVLGGKVGASRGAVMADYVDGSHQVGQTGITVRPKLYVACGISGAPQHIVGMKRSETVIAINGDLAAPIFQYSDYGIVGDLFEWIPKLKDAVLSRRKSQTLIRV
ncbi:MAG: electron transfer flavoprotein subunit alpha/FixB family protein [Candidatus Geothermarchaeales archaeon]